MDQQISELITLTNDLGSLIPFDVLCECLDATIDENTDFALLSYIKAADGIHVITPSLCIAKNRGFPAKLLKKWSDLISIGELHGLASYLSREKIESSIREHGSRNYVDLETLINLKIEEGFFQYDYNNLHVILLFRGDCHLQEETRDTLAQIASVLRERSLNRKNESRRHADVDWDKLSKDISSNMRQAASITARFFSTSYGVDAYHFRRYSRFDTWVCDSEFGSKQRRIRRQAQDSLEKFGTYVAYCRPFVDFKDGLHTMGIGFYSHEGIGPAAVSQNLPPEAIVLASKDCFRAFIADNLYVFVERFYRQLRPKKQAEHIVLLGNVTAKERTPLSSTSDFIKRLALYSKECFDEVLENSNAYSATLRLFSPETQTLNKIVECTRDGVVSCIPDEVAQSIPAHDVRNYMNAKAFNSQNRYAYASDITKGQGAVHRDGSVSELAFCLESRGSRIGTINFESVFFNALKMDQTYLELVRYRIESHARRLYEVNDQFWATRRVQVEANIHELKNLIANDFPKSVKDNALSLIQQLRPNAIAPQSRLGEIISFKDDFWRNRKVTSSIGSIGSLIDSHRIKNTPVEILNPNIIVDGDWLNVVKVIYRNMLSNFRRHSDSREDILVFKHTGEKSDPLTIGMQSANPMEKHMLDRATVAPLLTEESNGDRLEHWGLVMVGSLARHIGGFCYVYSAPSNGFSIHITIPLKLGEHSS